MINLKKFGDWLTSRPDVVDEIPDGACVAVQRFNTGDYSVKQVPCDGSAKPLTLEHHKGVILARPGHITQFAAGSGGGVHITIHEAAADSDNEASGTGLEKDLDAEAIVEEHYGPQEGPPVPSLTEQVQRRMMKLDELAQKEGRGLTPEEIQQLEEFGLL